MEYQPDSDVESLIRSILLETFPGGELGGIRFVGNGSVNAVYAAQLGASEVIIRLADARYREDEPRKEAWCLERAASVGVPGPKVFAVGRREQTVYLVQEFVQGVRGDDPSIDQTKVWHELGRYARRIHESDHSDFCCRADLAPGWAEREWARFVAYNLESLSPDDQLISLGVYSPTQQRQIRSVFTKLQSQSFRFGLNHGDLSVVNTIVRADGSVVLFDWGCANVDIIPHLEISSILRWLSPESPSFQAFLAGYELPAREWAALLPQIKDFQLLKSFDLVRWSIDRRPEQLDNYVANAGKQIEHSAF